MSELTNKEFIDFIESFQGKSFNNHKSVGAYHLQFHSGGVFVTYEAKRSVGMGIRPVWAE